MSFANQNYKKKERKAFANKILPYHSVIFLLLVISRSKLIPDFALTIHFVHLIATSLYTHSIPSNLLWWGLQCASAALMVFLGMWACQWRELQPISFGGIGGGGGSSSSTTATSSSEAQQQEQQQASDPQEAGTEEDLSSASRGRGRSRGLFREGGGGEYYEMGNMKGEQAV